MRTHMARSRDPIVLTDKIASTGGAPYKPSGFWYEVDGDWRRWCEAEEFSFGPYIHQVELNNCNMLFINSLNKFDDFNDLYIEKGGYRYGSIDWARVAERYDGIEIAPYQWKRRLNRMWYYGWDCASGVIWRPRDAKVTYIGKYQPGEQEHLEYTRKFREVT